MTKMMEQDQTLFLIVQRYTYKDIQLKPVPVDRGVWETVNSVDRIYKYNICLRSFWLKQRTSLTHDSV